MVVLPTLKRLAFPVKCAMYLSNMATLPASRMDRSPLAVSLTTDTYGGKVISNVVGTLAGRRNELSTTAV
jgi:hypothetical protein